MSSNHATPKTLFAPAKVNLFLHIVGRMKNGYHLLQSFVAFANFGDEIKILPDNQFSFSIHGNVPSLPKGKENLVVRAANRWAKLLDTPLNFSIHLTKKIPVGAGLGGGSTDAAATIKGLSSYRQKKLSAKQHEELLLQLGADLPVCYEGRSCFVEGIGEKITPLACPEKLPAVLIFPREGCSTNQIFKTYQKDFSPPLSMPSNISSLTSFYQFLKNQRNDLTESACQKLPVIREVLYSLSQQEGCVISRMSGSGSACFGLFETTKQSQNAADRIQKEQPNWWICPVLLG